GREPKRLLQALRHEPTPSPVKLQDLISDARNHAATRVRCTEDAMPEIMDGTTIAAAFAAAVAAHAGRPFLAVPANPDRAYLPSGFEMSYGEAGQRVEELAGLYRRAGYGVGPRVAPPLENPPQPVPYCPAPNSPPASCVPIHP